MGPVIFTDDVLTEARTSPRASEYLLYRLAVMAGPQGDALRAQLEAAAAIVPEGQRARVLGPLSSRVEDQAAGTMSVLLLALALHEFGWNVEHEPIIDGDTPDLRITKGSAEYIVEVRQVIGWTRDPNGKNYRRIEKALKGLRTRRPLHFKGTPYISGGASLKPFRKFVERVLAAGEQGEQVFEGEGVLIALVVDKDLGYEFPAYTGYTGPAAHGDDFDTVRVAIHEKLKKYKRPLIVALEMVDCIWPFDSVEQVLCGTHVMRIPISRATGGPAGEMELRRAADGIVIRKERDAERARERLDALLPFEIEWRGDGFHLGARVLANPTKVDPLLREFRPIPRLLVTDSRPGQATMAWFTDSDSPPTAPDKVEGWTCRPGRPSDRR